MTAQIHVLVIEDSDDDAALIMRELRRGGYASEFERVDTCQAMTAALDREPWDLIICDYTMPRFSMPEALETIKKRDLDLPFLIVSGAIGEEAAVAAMRAGVHDYIMKDKLARLVPVVERELREADVRRERRRAEEALRQSEHNYRTLFESAIDGILAIDLETLRIVLANQTAARMYGFESSGEVIGLNPLDYVSPADKDRALRGLVEGPSSAPGEVGEFQTRTRDGAELWVDIAGGPTQYRGKPVCMISIRDVNERKRAEREKKKMEHQLQLAGRLAVVGELASGIAHELRNPLAAIQAYAEFQIARQDLEQDARGDLEVIFKEAQRASRITGNLLSFAGRHKPEKRLVSINDAIDKSLELHTYRLRVNNIDLVLELERDLPLVKADPHQIQQVFVNIISNAEQAMTDAHGKGRLTIRTEKAQDMVRILFIDDGPGMPEDDLQRIFDPFFTTKEAGRGTGLGLSICFGLVQEHGGRLYATSERGEGATFTVEVPVVSEQEPSLRKRTL
ncbi:MAG: PAS domain S-box protein [Dehalococcoidia bacterium]|nr:PAS domain S-box protein [Dehalococcoidia bacterium]